MTNICVVLLCGLPGAGKTTFAKELGSYVGSAQGQDDKLVRCSSPDIAHVPGPAGLVDDNTNKAFRLVHICYDKLMPKEIESQLLKNVENDENLSTSAPDSTRSVLCSSSEWKDYRNNIVLLVDVVLEKLCRTFTGKSLEWQVAESLTREDYLVRAFQETVFDASALREVSTSNKFAVVIDDNMYYESMRYQYFKLARKCKTTCLE